MKFRASLAAVSLLVLGGASLASSAAALEQPRLTQTEPGVPSAVTQQDEAILAELNELSETQTEQEVAEILDSGERVQALYDSNKNEYVAAFVEEELVTVSPFAITRRGPGCATTDACIVNKKIGLYGTGWLKYSAPITGVTKLYSGNQPTMWWRSATVGIYGNKNVTTNISPAISLVSMNRG